MNDKKVIEIYKTARAVERSRPDPSVQIAARNDLIAMINHAWAEAKANPKVRNDTEGLQILRGLIESETDPVKREFHERLFGIADRLSHCKKSLLVSADDSSEIKSASNEPLPLFEKIRLSKNRS
jgi:hypothetical protein